MDALTPPAELANIAMPAPKYHDVTVVTTKKHAQAKVLGVPPEEFGIERGARDIKSCNYAYHEIVTKTEADLINEGFDETQVKALGSYTGQNQIETLARDTVQEHYAQSPSEANSAARLVRFTEHYVRMDYKGDGKPCLYMVYTGGDQGEVLKKDGKEFVEPIDVIPFAAVTPIPQPHRFFGRSIADQVIPIQQIKTALLRAALDSKYLSAGADIEISEAHAGPNTLDDLLGPKRPGRVIRTKQPGGLNYQVVPDTSESSFAAMTYMDSLLETKTGVAKQSQGIDANALQNQSATAVAQVFSASQMRMKLIARVFAEGVKDLFALLHHTIRSHGQQAQTVRLRNTWVQVDPRQWKTREDMTIHVGLGSGSKPQQFAQMMAIANAQKELILGGKTNLVDDQNLFNTMAELTKLLGHKNPDKFFNDPSAKDPQTGQPLHPPAQPPPDPAVLKIQADAAMKDKELQQRGQELQIKAQIDQQADQRKAEIESVQAQADIATQDRKTQSEMALAQQKFEFERELALLDHQLKREMQAAELEMKREQHQQAMAAGAFKVVAGAEAHSQKMEHADAAAKAKTDA